MKFFFHNHAVHLDIIKVLLPIMHKRIVLKGALKFPNRAADIHQQGRGDICSPPPD